MRCFEAGVAAVASPGIVVLEQPPQHLDGGPPRRERPSEFLRLVFPKRAAGDSHLGADEIFTIPRAIDLPRTGSRVRFGSVRDFAQERIRGARDAGEGQMYDRTLVVTIKKVYLKGSCIVETSEIGMSIHFYSFK